MQQTSNSMDFNSWNVICEKFYNSHYTDRDSHHSIVYLDRCVPNNNESFDLYIDFRTLWDFRKYLQFFDSPDIYEELSGASYIKLRNIRTKNRLIEGSYYSLDLVLLHITGVNARQENNQSDLVKAEYDFEIRESGAEYFDKMFTLASYTTPYPTYLKGNYALPHQLSIKNDPPYSLRVNDVGQANSNEILSGEDPIIVYDFGAPLSCSTARVNVLRNNRLPIYKRTQPILVISHWDLDHYRCLVGMSLLDLQCFSGVFCPEHMKSITSQKVFLNLYSALPGRVWSVIAPARRKSGQYNIHRVASYNADQFNLFVGDRQSNINFSGLLVGFVGYNEIAELTGDAHLSQADELLHKMNRINPNTMPNNIVVPHHGGVPRSGIHVLNWPINYIPHEALISVDANDPINNARYHHPDTQVINMYTSAGFSVERTDLQGDLIVNL